MGPPPGFQLTLGPFRQNCSTLPDRLSACAENTDVYRAGNMSFSTKWAAHFNLILTNNRDHGPEWARYTGGEKSWCANHYKAGWWFKYCFCACVTCPEINYWIHPFWDKCTTGGHAPTQVAGGGEFYLEKFNKMLRWTKAEFLLIPSKSPLTFNYRI